MGMHLEFILLGLVQGISEFFPISSSGHLVLIQRVFGLSEMLIFDIVVHFASLVAIVYVFRKSFLSLSVRRFSFLIIACVPTGISYFIFSRYIGSHFNDINYLWLFFFISGIVIYSTKFVRPQKNLSLFSVIAIGIAQAVALFPGVSRSGMTISVGLLSKLSKKDAVEFSFMLGSIAILGATLLKSKEIVSIDSFLVVPTIMGFFASLFSSIIALKIIIRFVEKSKFHLFGYYCWFMALVSLSIKFWL